VVERIVMVLSVVGSSVSSVLFLLLWGIYSEIHPHTSPVANTHGQSIIRKIPHTIRNRTEDTKDPTIDNTITILSTTPHPKPRTNYTSTFKPKD
jgi:hypothetical protein